MPRILFRIPIGQDRVPVYTFGVILFAAYLLALWLGWRLARKAGVGEETYQRWAIGGTVLCIGIFSIAMRL